MGECKRNQAPDKPRNKSWTWIVGCLGIHWGMGLSVSAQIVPDQTLPINSRVTPNCIRCVIEGGTIRGNHLFHSFDRFSVPTGAEAHFNNGLQIQNILARVTGNLESNIDGLIRANGTANLFLLNPNGIIFGPNARLQLGGSFTASTASSFQFPDGSEFSATRPQAPPLLKINVPLGLQYGPSRPDTRLTNAGSLAVGTGQTLTLAGGTVTSRGTLIAPGGRVEVLGNRVALLNQAQIDVSAPGGGGTVLIGGDFQGQGTVPTASRTFVGPDVVIRADAIGHGNGGNVIVWADETTRFYGKVSAKGGDISGNGGFVEVSGKQFLDYNGQTDTHAAYGVTGTLLLDPTNIEIVSLPDAETLDLANIDEFADPDVGLDGTTQIAAEAISFLANTDVVLQASNNITFNAPIDIFLPGVGLTAQAGNNIFVNSSIATNQGTIRLSAGDSGIGTAIANGSITIRANMLSGGGDVALNSPGTVLINNDANVLTNSNILNGNAGNVTVVANQLILQDGAQLGSPSFGDGNAGDVNIRARVIELSETPGRSTAIGAPAQGVSGNAGRVTIEAERLTVQDGAQVTVTAFGGSTANAGNVSIQATEVELLGDNSGIFANTEPGSSGNGGSISINVQRLTARDGALVYAGTQGGGGGGQINVKASEVELTGTGPLNASALSANSVSPTGNAGQISIKTGRLLIQNGAILDARSAISNGGDITVQSANSVTILNGGFLGNSSTLGTGGNLVIETPNLVLQNGAIISTGTAGQTFAGNITIRKADSIIVDRQSVISAISFGSGTGGDLFLETNNLTIDTNSGVSTSSAGSGNAGNLTVLAKNAVNVNNGGLLSTGSVGSGTGGNLLIETTALNVQNTGKIFTSSLDATTFDFSSLNSSTYPPEVVAQLREIVNLVDQSDFSQGNSGNLTVLATDSVTLDYGILSTLAQRKASGGKLSVQTGQLTIQNNADISSASFGKGNGGAIEVQANSLNLRNNGLISSRSEGQGAAGDITIRLNGNLQANRGEITATSFLAGGGDVNITARDILLRNGSLISTSVFDSTGGGGNITIRSRSFVALEDSDILANAEFGPGGNIFISSPAFLAALFRSGRATPVGRNPGSFGQFRGNGRVDISADSRFGQSGTVVYPNVDPGRGLVALNTRLVDPTTQFDRRCEFGSSFARSSFIVTGRGGFPTDPTDILRDEEAQLGDSDWIDLEELRRKNRETNRARATDGATDEMDGAETDRKAEAVNRRMSGKVAQTPVRIVEAQGIIQTPDGRIYLVADVPAQAMSEPLHWVDCGGQMKP
jgi:filamentous hemagglutinin family protein